MERHGYGIKAMDVVLESDVGESNEFYYSSILIIT